MGGSRSFEHVLVWQQAHAWVLGVYTFTSQLPQHELFGLTAQLRRAAVSVPGNFVEGFKRQTRLDKLRFYNIAQASLEESRYYLLLAQDLGYGNTTGLRADAESVSRLLEAYAGRVREAETRDGTRR